MDGQSTERMALAAADGLGDTAMVVVLLLYLGAYHPAL